MTKALCRQCGSVWYEKRDINSLRSCPYCLQSNNGQQRIIVKASKKSGSKRPTV